MNQAINQYIETASEDHQSILQELRKLILTIAPESEEQFKWKRPVYRLEKDFCYLAATKKHVTLGFFEFDKITTNKNLLEGTGKSMRHIKIQNTKDIYDFNVKQMLEEVLK